MHQLFNFCSPKHHCAKTGTQDVNFDIIATVMQQRNKQTNKQIKEMLNLGGFQEEWDNIQYTAIAQYENVHCLCNSVFVN